VVAVSGGTPRLVAVYLLVCCLLTTAAVWTIRNNGVNSGKQ
jgi:hypothetical protein